MLTTLLRHEWTLLRRDAVGWTVLLVFVALLALAAAMGVARARGERRVLDDLQAQVDALPSRLAADARAHVIEPDELPPWGPRHPDYIANDRGTYAALPPAPLLALATGQTDVLPHHYKVTARRRDASMTGDQIEHPLRLLTGRFDVAFAMLYLYPLLILAVSFDLTASERERGTLRMVLAQAVPLARLVAAKAIVRAIVVAVPPIVVVAATLGAAGGPVDRGALLRAGLWLIAVIAYGLCWFGVALVVNARGWTSSANALALAGVWLLLVVVAPTTVNLATSVLAPVPSRVEFAIATRVATRDAVADGSRVLGHFLEDHPTASNIGRGGMQQYALLQAARDADVERRLRPVLDRYRAALDAQRALVARLRFLSPAMLMQMTLLDIAGVADERHRHFVGQVEAFQRSWQDFFSPRVLAVSPLGDDEYVRLPAFRYQEEPVAGVVARVWTSLVVLVAMGLALCGLGALAYRRYSVTH